MKGFYQALFLLGYILMVGPPRARDLQAAEHRTHGELDGKPLIVVLGVELMIRSGLLLFVAALSEELLGDLFYEQYRLDLLMAILLVSGVVHTAFYYLFLGVLLPRVGATALRLYRLCRNLTYAALPGLAAVVPVLIWQAKNQIPPFSGDLVETTYLATTGLMVIAGVIEAIIVNRRPLGLDQSFQKPDQQPD